ncbi:MAG: TlpA family protein disulfide reductase [candidate division WOR-3 bacterium]|nr:TlpA family protein disulfide reductase [candidate division WOR-3 bacterium]
MNKKIITILGIIVLVLCANKNGNKSVKETNDFTLKSIDGKEYTLSKLKGNVVILDFWATWCPPCRREIPHLIALYDKYKDKGLIILGISTEDKQTLETFSRENNVNYPILLGNDEVFRKFGVRSIPHTLFIDKKGNVRKLQIGYSDELIPYFEALIDTLISE